MSTRISAVISAILTPLLVLSPVWAQTPVPLNNSPLDNASQPIQLNVVASDGPRIQVNSRAVKGFTVQVTDSTGAGITDAAVAFRLPDSGPTGVFADGTHSAVAYTDASGSARLTGIQWNQTPGDLAIRVTATKGTSHAGILMEQTLCSPTELKAAATAVAPPSDPVPAVPAMPPPVPGSVLATTGASASAQSATPKPSPNTSIAKVDPAPSVSVTSASPEASQHSGKTKWLVIAAIAAGAGVGVAMAERGKSSNTSTSASAVSIGTPTLSVGHP